MTNCNSRCLCDKPSCVRYTLGHFLKSFTFLIFSIGLDSLLQILSSLAQLFPLSNNIWSDMDGSRTGFGLGDDWESHGNFQSIVVNEDLSAFSGIPKSIL